MEWNPQRRCIYINNIRMDRTCLYQFHMGPCAFLGKRERKERNGRYGAFFKVMSKNYLQYLSI